MSAELTDAMIDAAHPLHPVPRAGVDEIRARWAECPEPGPWKAVVGRDSHQQAEWHVVPVSHPSYLVCATGSEVGWGSISHRDADTIAAAPSDVAALLAEVDRLTAREVEARAIIEAALADAAARDAREAELRAALADARADADPIKVFCRTARRTAAEIRASRGAEP